MTPNFRYMSTKPMPPYTPNSLPRDKQFHPLVAHLVFTSKMLHQMFTPQESARIIVFLTKRAGQPLSFTVFGLDVAPQGVEAGESLVSVADADEGSFAIGGEGGVPDFLSFGGVG